MDISFFTDHLNRFSKAYNPTALFDKIKNVAKTAGIKTIYAVLTLYYATFDPALPLQDRLMVIAALGYFIIPVDAIPDALPLGFTDDATALMFVVRHIWGNLSPETSAKARAKLAEWFPSAPAPTLP